METSEEEWSHGDTGQSHSNQQQADPCAQVVQVLQCYHQVLLFFRSYFLSI